MDTKLQSYDFFLPNELIANEPIYPKESAKLLVYKDKKIIHTTFKYLFDFIPRDFLIVLNDTRVLNARLFCVKQNTDSKESSKKEIFYHKHLGNNIHLVQIKGKVKINDKFRLDSNIYLEVVNIRNDGFREVVFYNSYKVLESSEVYKIFEMYGNIPLPPYIKRRSTADDKIHYQSIFAKNLGSIAAPTASLHFSQNMLNFLESNYNIAYITLHVGAGTFKPVVTNDIREHKIHTEYCEILESSTQKIKNANKILCIGTTAFRCVEWFVRSGQTRGENDIFLHPQNKPFKANALLTNFHLPKSSLLMLVSSLIGRKETLNIYAEAIKHKYRFYSYGDGMLII